MKYAKFIKPGDTIGVNAPSFSCGGYRYMQRMDKIIKFFKESGYNFKLSKNLYGFDIEDILGSQADFKTKANEFMEQYLDDEVDIVWAVAGGEIENETIKYIDFEKLKNAKPKYFLGFSDNTWLTFLLTTICDVCSIYTYNLPSLGADKLHKSQEELISMLEGKLNLQHSFDYYELEDLSKDPNGNPLAPINDVVKTNWKSLKGNSKEEINGRIIGGCLDVLVNIMGTKYDKVEEFSDKYKDDGIVFYLESCDLNVLSQLRAYEQIKNSNWLKHCKGIVIGRPIDREAMFGVDYEKMLHIVFDELDIPVIYDFDTGHLPPIVSLFSGSYAKIKLENKKGTIETLFI